MVMIGVFSAALILMLKSEKGWSGGKMLNELPLRSPDVMCDFRAGNGIPRLTQDVAVS
jgi:hypothetical protein